MSKYSFDLKLEAVKDYLSGETGGYKVIAKKHGVINHNQVIDWVENYERY